MWKITLKDKPIKGKCVIIYHKRKLFTHTGTAVLVFDEKAGKDRFVCDCGGYADLEDVPIYCDIPKIDQSMIDLAELDFEVKNMKFDYQVGEWVQAELNF